MANALELAVLARAVVSVGLSLEAKGLQEGVHAGVVLGAVNIGARKLFRGRCQRFVVLDVGGDPRVGRLAAAHARVGRVRVCGRVAGDLDVRREVLLAGNRKDVGLATGNRRDLAFV